jgi:RHS repeat-associated protein
MRQVTGGNLLGETVNADINNLIEKSSNTYDGFNRLTKVEKVKGGKRSTVEFIYDGDDLRTTKTVHSSEAGYETKVTNYLYDRQYVILETDASDEVITRYIKGVNYIARINGSNKLSYYLFNGHGDVVQTVSEAGQVENQYDYDIFGNPILTVEAEYKNAIRYAGEFYDDETGLYYLRARYYDPYIGRFISEDSYWGEDTNPLSLNLYTYTYNNPIMYIDPTGHSAEAGEYDTSYESYETSGALGYITYDEYVTNVTNAKKAKEKKEASNDSSSGGSSGSGGLGGRQSDVPADLDWDQDGKVDTRKDKANFDKNNNAIADWLEKDTDEDWVFNGSDGWDDIEVVGDVEGPTAEDIRLEYDEFAMYEGSFTSGGIPDYQFFNNYSMLANLFHVEGNLDSSYISNSGERVQILSAFDSDEAKMLKHFSKGIWTGAKEGVLDTWELIKHPLQTAEAVGELAKALLLYTTSNPPNPVHLLPIAIPLGESIMGEIERWDEGDKFERSEQVGEYVGGTLIAAAGTKGIGIVLKQIRLTKKVLNNEASVSEIKETLDATNSNELKEQLLLNAELDNYTDIELQKLLDDVSDPDLKNIIESDILIPNIIPDKGFASFRALKNYVGYPGDGNVWHHLVEQSQVGKRANFPASEVNNVNNIISIPHGNGTVHSKISAHYSSKFDHTNGLTVRDWLATQSFEDQFKYGKELLEEFGDVTATSKGWEFTEFK